MINKINFAENEIDSDQILTVLNIFWICFFFLKVDVSICDSFGELRWWRFRFWIYDTGREYLRLHFSKSFFDLTHFMTKWSCHLSLHSFHLISWWRENINYDQLNRIRSWSDVFHSINIRCRYARYYVLWRFLIRHGKNGGNDIQERDRMKLHAFVLLLVIFRSQYK